MIRIVYIAGPYRHVNKNGYPGTISMAMEVEDECAWCTIIAESGHMWIAPLCNSINVEDAGASLTADDYIDRDIQLINRLVPEQDILLCRPGAFSTFEQSIGANRELAAATERGLIIMRAYLHEDPEQAFIESMRELDMEVPA